MIFLKFKKLIPYSKIIFHMKGRKEILLGFKSNFLQNKKLELFSSVELAFSSGFIPKYE